jgi:hypothetical protein
VVRLELVVLEIPLAQVHHKEIVVVLDLMVDQTRQILAVAVVGQMHLVVQGQVLLVVLVVMERQAL